MLGILIIGYSAGARRWEHELVDRLRAAGHPVGVRLSDDQPPASAGLDLVLGLEGRRFGASLATRSAALAAASVGDPALVIDLTGRGETSPIPVLTVEFAGETSLSHGLSRMLTGRQSAEITARLDGLVVGRARPMIGDRVWLSRGSNDLLSGAISLIEQSIARFRAGRLLPREQPVAVARSAAPGLVLAYLPSLVRGLAIRAGRKLRLGRRPFYWQVGFRLIGGPGVAGTGRLDGAPFETLPDDGARFYADPFAFEHLGRQFVFVEEFPYATNKGVISVAELGPDGQFETPRVVLEEPHHLSYPQVFEQDGEIYMIPESSAAQELVLYRAVQFPHRWVRDTVLVAGKQFNDATLLERNGRFWLVGTQRCTRGSSSDTMAVYGAPSLRGPWTPHAMNPIVIDHSAARPGGRSVEQDGRLMLPVQNGSLRYGGGLSFVQLLRLDDEDVLFSEPQAIGPGEAWESRSIHTLNRTGRLEVVDRAD